MMKQLHNIRSYLRRTAFVVAGLIVLLASSPASADPGYSNLSAGQLARMGIYFVDGDYNCENSGDLSLGGPEFTSTDTSDPGHSGSWASGLEPPYILEQFMVETLKDLARKLNVDPSNTVTEEHVIALVAFAIGEGGDINNSYLFNPMNNGLNAPDLLAGDHVGDGRQSYKSFDAGVEGLARSFTINTQNRLGTVLAQQQSSARDFMVALTYWDRWNSAHSGQRTSYNTPLDENKFWAAASLAPNQDSYFDGRLRLVSMVRQKYESLAGLVIGTPQLEFQTRTVQPSKLQFHPVSSADTDVADSQVGTGQACECQFGENSSGGCLGSAGDGDIVKEAMRLAWPNKDHCQGRRPCPGERKADATPAYQETMPNTAGEGQSWRNNDDPIGDPAYSDCGVFVATAIISSGADLDFPRRGTDNQRPYMLTHTATWQQVDPNPATATVEHITNSSQLLPGDVLVTYKGTGHIYIFTGPQEQSTNLAVSASWGRGTGIGHVPESSGFYQDVDGQSFIAFRLKR